MVLIVVITVSVAHLTHVVVTDREARYVSPSGIRAARPVDHCALIGWIEFNELEKKDSPVCREHRSIGDIAGFRAEQVVAADGASMSAFREVKSLQPAPLLNLGVRRGSRRSDQGHQR
jgi:hypothetical protein